MNRTRSERDLHLYIQESGHLNDSVCTGGKLVDIVEVANPADANDIYAILFISDSGKVLTYVDPENLDVSGANRRSLGYAVRLQ